jgi:hypothetical protein
MPPDFLARGNAHFDQAEATSLVIRRAVVETPAASSFADLSDAANCSDFSVEAYVQAGVALATRRAYRADFDHFEAWGGNIPATDDGGRLPRRPRRRPEGLDPGATSGCDLSRSRGQGPPKSGSQSIGPDDDAASAVLTGPLSVRPSPSSARTSLPFSGRWVIGSRTCEIGRCC